MAATHCARGPCVQPLVAAIPFLHSTYKVRESTGVLFVLEASSPPVSGQQPIE